MKLSFGSCFAGLGGIDTALEQAGMRCEFQIEIDGDCQRVLAHHWPDVPKFRDIQEVNADELRRVDVLAGGVPCQDWSVAGKRAGLAGKRSGLFFDFARLADTLAPAVVLFENVPGLLSSGPGCDCERCEQDLAFVTRYKTSEKRCKEIEAANRRIQRHKQALIGEDFATVLECLTGFRPAVPEGGWRNSGVCVGPKRGACWRVLNAQHFGVAQRRRRVFLVASPGDGRGPCSVLFEPESCDGNSPPRRQAGAGVAGTLGGGTKGRGWSDDFDRSGAFLPVTAALRGGHHGPDDNAAQAGHLISHAPQSVGADASEDGTGRGTPLAVVYSITPDAFDREGEGSGGTLAERPGLGIIEGQTQALRAKRPNAVAFQERGRNDGPTLETQEELAYSLMAPKAGGQRQTNNIAAGMVVRRLTPLECLRLQGLPDDWLSLDPPLSDSAKYRLIGNSVAVPVLWWIGERIVNILQESTP